MEEKVLQTSNEEYFHNNIACVLLSRLEQIEEAVALNRTLTEIMYAVYVQYLHRTVNILVSKEVECTEKAVVWPGTWLPEEKVNQLDYASVLFKWESTIHGISHFMKILLFLQLKQANPSYWPKLF